MPYKDPVKLAQYKYDHSTLPKSRASQKRYRIEHPDYNKSTNPSKRNSHLKTRYGITDLDYQTMLANQGGTCAVCHRTNPTHSAFYFDVDHNHITGQVRGLLCRECNVTLSIVENKRELLCALELYLLQHIEYDPQHDGGKSLA